MLEFQKEMCNTPSYQGWCVLQVSFTLHFLHDSVHKHTDRQMDRDKQKDRVRWYICWYKLGITTIRLQFKTWCIHDKNVGKATIWVVPEICQHNVNINFCHPQIPELDISNKNTTRTNNLLTNMQVRPFGSLISREKSVELSLIQLKGNGTWIMLM